MESKINMHTIIKILLKLLEITCVITAISLTTGHHFFVDEFRGASFFTDGTLMLGIILTPFLLAIDIFGKKETYLFGAVLTFVLSVFFIATGSVGIQYWNIDMAGTPMQSVILPKARGMGAMCIIAGFFYLIDTIQSVIMFKASS